MLRRIIGMLLALFPILLAILGFIIGITAYTYPKFNWWAVLFAVLAILPSVFFLIATRVNPGIKKIIKAFILLLCVISIPFSFIFPIATVQCSETTDITNYRKLDPDCIANRSALFQDLFPTWPNYFKNVENERGGWDVVYLDAKYYYHYYRFLDYTYDIYAEWPLDGDKFTEEVKRARGVMEESKHGIFLEINKGDFTCLIRYLGNEPFKKATDNYTYFIFAYNEKTNVVRYIMCDSLENGVDQPYYLQLEW